MAESGEFLTNKRVLLNAPGVRKTELYYLENETKVDEVETQVLFGRYEQSLNLFFGTTSNMIIPNSGNFIHHCVLHIKLPPVQENEFLPRMWGYSLLSQITWTLGASTQSQLRLDGKTIFQTVMSMCKTSEKKNAIMSLGGSEYTSSSNGESVEAIVFLPLPWSSLNAEESCKLGIDTGLLTSQINVQITLNPASSIYGGSATHPLTMEECHFITREQELSNKHNSLRKELMGNSEMMLAYPFIRRESPTPKYTVSETNVTLSIQEFLESDLQGILFTAHLVEDQDNAGGFAPNPLFALECTDLELLYNGQTLAKYRGKMGNLIDMLYDNGSSHIDNSRIARTSTSSGVPSSPDHSHVYSFPMNILRKNISYEGVYSNTPRFANQTMQLKLKIKNPPNLTVPQTGQPQPCIVHFTYLYSAVAEIQNGVSTITFA
jgi:hypothetical protein